MEGTPGRQLDREPNNPSPCPLERSPVRSPTALQLALILSPPPSCHGWRGDLAGCHCLLPPLCLPFTLAFRATSRPNGVPGSGLPRRPGPRDHLGPVSSTEPASFPTLTRASQTSQKQSLRKDFVLFHFPASRPAPLPSLGKGSSLQGWDRMAVLKRPGLIA